MENTILYTTWNKVIVACIVGTTVLFSPLDALAKKRKKKGSKQKSSIVDDYPTNRVRSGSSKDIRGQKKFSAFGEIGLINVFAFGKGVRAGFYLSDSLAAEALYFNAEFSFLGYSTEYDMIEGRVKWWVGNSFYVYGGGGLQILTSVDPSYSLSSGSEISSNHLIAEGGIGNAWAFGTLSLGCDWVGAAYPIVELSSKETFPADASEDSITSDRNSFKAQAGSANLMLVRFYLGVHF